MNKENTISENEPEPDSIGAAQPGFWARLISFFDFRRPGTKEDLDHEIQELLEEGEEHGLISPLEEKMINSILEFRDTYASEIMTPAAEVVSFDESLSMSELLDVVVESGFTRIPVYRDNPDKVVGLVHAKDLLQLITRTKTVDVSLADCLRPVYFVPETKPISDLLREFQKRKLHIAMVVDEFGTMRGLITLEDILEEIVGEIDDEYDDEDDTFELVSDNCVDVHGWVDIEKIEEFFNVKFPDGLYESVGGLIIHQLGRLAEDNDVVIVEGIEFRVQSASERQIEKIRVTRLPSTKE